MDVRIAVFVALMVLAAGLVPWLSARMRKQGRGEVLRAISRLETQGWVAQDSLDAQGRKRVRVWGRLAHPVALDLRVTRRSRLWPGRASASGGMLDPVFESAFKIVSGEPERARMILEPALQQGLLRWPRAELRLGSYESLLPREYCAGEQAASSRRLRTLWMIRVPGTLAKLSGPDETRALAELGCLLADAASRHCLPPGSPEAGDFQTKDNEAWL
jgi:hypothetical protein